MNYAEYVRNVEFRFLSPASPRPTGFRAAARVLRSLGLDPEIANTRLPEDSARMKRRLRDVCRLPRMSTFAIGSLINRAVENLPDDEAYLNVGVWHGFTFFSGLAGNSGRRCIGVDDFSHKNSPRGEFLDRFESFRGDRHEFYEADFRDYLRDVHTGRIGVYLFDGPHRYEDQLDGLKLAEPHFSDDCLVMVDDSNWDDVRRANLDFIEQSPHEYRMLLDVQTPQSGHPSWWNGLMLFQRAS